jgi:hypothetical protein
VVADQREVPLELNDAGQLALLPGAADRFGGRLIYNEHVVSMGVTGRAEQG